ncbi:unnamed protein product [Adineta steineri]|uniref:Uncharacterized protein n=1 Tax=Adineta steineri TaxID=433720 RepID=A0A813X4J1_9BILA|nr:unnamed protein product [Adineta steineri]CAF0864806.1 unnamed protein product [Adineta steineri]
MTVKESQIFFQWLFFILISIFILIIIVGFFCWYAARRRQHIQHSNQRNLDKVTVNKKPIQQTLFSKNEYLPSSNYNLKIKSRSASSSQLTNTDIAHLDKLIRTASDRSIWKQNYSKINQYNKPRKVPSGHIQHKI